VITKFQPGKIFVLSLMHSCSNYWLLPTLKSRCSSAGELFPDSVLLYVQDYVTTTSNTADRWGIFLFEDRLVVADKYSLEPAGEKKKLSDLTCIILGGKPL